MASTASSGRDTWKRRGAAALVLLAIAFLFLVPDPHDHGDAGSLGGFFRLLLPGSTRLTTGSSTPTTGGQHTSAKPRPGPQEICPIHFWQQVASTMLLLALLLRFFPNSEFRVPPFVLLPGITSLGSFYSRAPPITS